MVTRGTVRARTGYIYAPLGDVFYPLWKIRITADDGTIYYIADFTDSTSATKNYLINANISCPLTTGLARATIRFDNNNGFFTNKFNGGEIVEIFADYTDASTLIFKGKVDNPKMGIDSTGGFYIETDARTYSEFTDRSIIGMAINSLASVAICDLIYDNGFTDIKLDYWNGTSWVRATFDHALRNVTWSGTATGFPTELVTMSWQNKKPWTTVSEICGRVGLECYMEYDTSTSTYVIKTFLTDSVKNNLVSVTYGSNLISCTDFGPDNTDVYNHITVYGKQESDNIILLSTKSDATSITSLWRKEKVISDTSLATMSEVSQKAAYELAQSKDSKISGNLRCVGSHIIKPGQQIMVYIPNMAISGYYTISNYTHNIDSSGFITTINIAQKQNQLSQIFKEKVNVEDESKPYTNLNAMTDSYNVYFNESPSIMTHSNTQESEGQLMLIAGQTTGFAIADTITASYNITSCEFRKYSNFPIDQNDVYEVSNDDGVTYETYNMTSGEIHTFSSIGNKLKFKITLNRSSINDVSPTYESVVLLYK